MRVAAWSSPGALSGLQRLDVSGNLNLGGRLPKFNKMVSLTYFGGGYAGFRGPLPDWNETSLKLIYLDNNLLTGISRASKWYQHGEECPCGPLDACLCIEPTSYTYMHTCGLLCLDMILGVCMGISKGMQARLCLIIAECIHSIHRHACTVAS